MKKKIKFLLFIFYIHKNFHFKKKKEINKVVFFLKKKPK